MCVEVVLLFREDQPFERLNSTANRESKKFAPAFEVLGKKDSIVALKVTMLRVE